MAHRLERHDRHAVCDDYRDDPSAGYGKLSAVSVKGRWRSARIHSDRRIDLLVRSFEKEIEDNFELEAARFSCIKRDGRLGRFSRPQNTKSCRSRTLDDALPSAQFAIKELSVTAA